MEGPSGESSIVSEVPSPSVEPIAEELTELLERAKKTLPVAYLEYGPPLSFDFDPVPCGGRSMEESFGKSKKMVIGDYDAEAAADGSIQEIRKRQGWAAGLKRKNFGPKAPAGGFGEMESGTLTTEGFKVDKETEKEFKRREKRLHKEQERLQREQQKELERQQREMEKKLKAQQKEEEKQKQQLERDMKKLERDLERERKAEERKKQQEVKRREKDLQKALAAQVKVAQKELQKELAAGPPDDLELEMAKLAKEAAAKGVPIERPHFPPVSLQLAAAFPQLGNKMGGDVVMIWGFVQSFGDIMALPPFSINDLIAALHAGQKSVLLSSIHIVLIRLLQADMEESHHLVLTQGSGGTSNFMDRAVVGIAGTLDEAVSWGFDVDTWRAHLNHFTWPEILRQIAIAAGYGAKRSRGLRDKYQKSTDDGEDAIAEESRAGYGLKMPSRLTQGTVKAAAWQVLSEVGPEGLTISEIATRIQKQGLRDLRTSKTPEATVAGALSRDAVFCRVAPATYALHAVLPSAETISHPCGPDQTDPSVMDMSPGDGCVPEVSMQKLIQGEEWIPLLSNNDYDTLSIEQKLEVLKTLCSMALECPTIRACLEARLEREIAEQKRLDIEAKAEKRARREQAMEETQRRLMELENTGAVDGHENLDAKVKDLMTETMQTAIPGSLTSASYASPAQDHVRFEPLGKDRRYNRYWNFCFGKKSLEGESQPLSGHLFAELNGQFKVVESNEQLETLIQSLEQRGAREGQLYCALKRYQQNLPTLSPVWQEGEDGSDRMDIEIDAPAPSDILFAKRWSRPSSRDRDPGPHQSLDWLDQLKALMQQIHRSLGPDASPDLDSAEWSAELEAAASLEDLLVCIGTFEHALKAQALHSNYNRSPQILYGAWSDTYSPETVNTAEGFLSWVPRSYAAAFLHVFALDAALNYQSGQTAGREALLAYKYVQKPFVRELNAHLDVTPITYSFEGTSQIVSVEPLRPGGKLINSAFPVLQKGTPVQKRPVPFAFQVEKVREAVTAAERNGTLYANIQLTKGRNKSSGKQNGTNRSVASSSSRRAQSELEDDISLSETGAMSDETAGRSEEF